MWPKLSTINEKVYKTITEIDNQKASQLNIWVRLFSGVGDGLIMVSNPDTKLFAAAGEGGIYGFAGNEKESGYSGTLGTDWKGNPINPLNGRSLRPSPIVTNLEFTEGEDQISRTGKINLTCYSLEQLEAIQQYFMEPGFHLFVDWGWNTNDGARGLTRVKTKDVDGNPLTSTQIVASASNDNLRQSNMIAKKTTTNGQYDSFLGFIVGGTVSGGGQSFEVSIELRGTPQLPTYFQSHEINYKKNKENDGILAEQISVPYPPSNIIQEATEGETSDDTVRNRRFSLMYNELPSKRQLQSVKDLKSRFKYTDFINFDSVVSKSINSYTKNGFWATIANFSTVAEETIKLEVDGQQKDFSIDRAKLFSFQKYIKFDKAIDILNKNGGLSHFKIGDQEVEVTLDISDVKIGSFPLIFSTKKEVMIIPGTIPDFSKLAFNAGGLNYNEPETIDNKIDGIRFSQNSVLKEGTLSDSKNYWGYLKNLYINADMFEKKITQSQKNIREVILDILNEMSSAVNGFWDFQIVEGESKGGNITFTVIDRNWIGKSDRTKVREFVHDGEKSRFLDATLDIDIPGEMANQIISKRLNISPGGQQPEVKTNTFFAKGVDKFMRKANFKGVELSGEDEDTDSGTTIDEGSIAEKEKEISDLDSNIKSRNQENQNQEALDEQLRLYTIKSKDGRRNYEGKYPVVINGVEYKDANAIKSERSRIGSLQYQNRKANNIDETKKENAEKELNNQKIDEKISAIEENLKKIEILPNPELKTEINVEDASLSDLLSKPPPTDNSEDLFRKSFRIYCFNDTNFLDILKKKMLALPTDRLSHPLPIKYSFTILGNSGLQRGDTFNIIGIPKKYRNNGLFQISELTHTITGMTWKTRVQGLYRQTQ
tara:strand:+ start:6376 stop:9024 length:2649 start_codon:yes stop_codon:yes gene_type:complete